MPLYYSEILFYQFLEEKKQLVALPECFYPCFTLSILS